jgi:tetratricopeptide (TPR) repeat protein
MRNRTDQVVGRGRISRVRTLLWIGLLASWWCIPAAAEEDPFGLRPLGEAETHAIDRARAAVIAGRTAGGFRILDSLAASAAARGDRAPRYDVSVAVASLYAWMDEARRADAILRPILGRIEACGDTALYLTAAMWFGKALLDQSRLSEAESGYRHLVPAAARSGDADREGWARMGLAFIALASGRDEEARDEYASAERLLRECGNHYGEIEALIGLGHTHQQAGESDGARASFAEAGRRARRYGLPRGEALALNNLGTEEYARGDPAAALSTFRAAWKIGEASGDRRETTIPASNVAQALAALGRYDEAASVLDSLSRSCRAEGFADYEAVTLLTLGRLWLDAGHPLRAQRTYQRVLDLGDELPIRYPVAAYSGYAEALARVEGPAKGLEILTSDACVRLRPVLPPDQRVEYDAKLAQLLAECGRYAEAAASAEAAEPEANRLGRAEVEISLLTTAARARLKCGDTRVALDHLARATEAWERFRKRPSDPEWRELWTDGMLLTSTLIQALLANPEQPSGRARVQAAFEAAQRFKARGLAERIQGNVALRSPAPSISLDQVQQDLLHPGEVLLDAFVGPDSSFIFAVTRERCELIRLPGEAILTEKIVLLNALFSAYNPGDAAEREATLREVAERFSSFLLGGARDLVGGSERILFAPDGPLHLLPLDLLRVDGSDPGPAGWFGATRVCARIPSIAHLARLREVERDGDMGAAGDDAGILLCGEINSAGRRLAGTEAEVRSLRRRFRNFRAERDQIDSAAAASTNWLAGYRILHFAAHTDLNEAYPWRSGILMRSTGAPGQARLLCAETIAAVPLDARLVFISGCESARGRVIRGEGIQGLSTAFLAAGARTVVATLWPVEDRATARFVTSFYNGLAHGQSAGEALREAKLQVARSRRYRDPSYWAGFVLIGEPEVGVNLQPPWYDRIAFRIAALSLVLIAALAISVGRRGRVIPSAGNRPT